MSPSQLRTVDGDIAMWTPSGGRVAFALTRADCDTGIPKFAAITTRFRVVPAPTSNKPGSRLLATQTRTIAKSEIKNAHVENVMIATTRNVRAIRSIGQSFSLIAPIRSISPPVAIAVINPRTSALASMRVASYWLARETPPEFRERLVVDRRQVTNLERGGPSPLEKLVQGTHNGSVELNALVFV